MESPRRLIRTLLSFSRIQLGAHGPSSAIHLIVVEVLLVEVHDHLLVSNFKILLTELLVSHNYYHILAFIILDLLCEPVDELDGRGLLL